jgi:AcrR family transcriptional regulator
MMATARKDQVRNRARIIDAAVAAFVERGPEISLDDIARLARVGPATLYRHFPARDDLVEAALDQMAAAAAAKCAPLATTGSPRDAFRHTLYGLCNLEDSAMGAFARLAATSPRAERQARAIVAAIVGPVTLQLINAGGLRPGVDVDQVVTFIHMVEGVSASTDQRKLALEVILDGLIR